MLLIEDDKLVHVDSSLDILEHYGVKGMKWGKRLRNARNARVSGKKDLKRLKREVNSIADGHAIRRAISKKIYDGKLDKLNDENANAFASKNRDDYNKWFEDNKISDRYSKNKSDRQKQNDKIYKDFKTEAKDYSSKMADAKYRSKTQKLIDKYSKTDDLSGLTEKGIKKKSKLDRKKSKYASKQEKKMDSRYGYIKDRVVIQ